MIVVACTAIPLAMALTQGVVETVAVAAGLAVGALYSLPPFRLKRFPVAASLCITGVRSLVVNLGVYWHFAGDIDAAGVGAVPVRAAVQLRDRGAQGRAGHRGRPAVQHPHVHGPARRPSGCSGIGLAALAIAYAGMIFVGAVRCSQTTRSPWFWSVGHLARRRRCSGTGRGSADPRDRTGFTRFYMRVWALFFLEYMLVPDRVPRDLTFVGRQVENKASRLAREAWTTLHARGRFVSNVDCLFEADQQPRAGRHPGDPHQALRRGRPSRTPSRPPRRAPHGGGRRGVTSRP